VVIARRSLLALAVVSPVVALGCRQPTTPDDEPTRSMRLRLLMRTDAGTDRAVAAARPVFAGDGLAFEVERSEALALAVVDRVDRDPSAQIVAGSNGRRVPASGWIELHDGVPEAVIAVVAAHELDATRAVDFARRAQSAEGFDQLAVAFEPTPGRDGLPRRRFTLHGWRLGRAPDGAVEVFAPARSGALVALLTVSER
jgi:hypothetical protein